MFFSAVEVWGHRGWPARYPDNTVAGIRAAAAVAMGVEIDVRRSADGRLVLAHDPDVAGLSVHKNPWSALADVDLAGHRPALLDDVLDVDARLDIEVKNIPLQPGFDPRHRVALDVADRARPGDVVTSFWWPSVDAIRPVRPTVETGLLFAAPMSPLLAIRHAVDHGHETIAPQHELVDEALMDQAGREGLRVMAWTVDETHIAVGLADLGVAAIITNRPGELIAEDPTGRNRP